MPRILTSNLKTDNKMSTNDDEKLTNIMMGKAVMALLQQGEPLLPAQVAAELRLIATAERHPGRKQACERAISEVLSGESEPRDAREERQLSVAWPGRKITLH